MACQMYQSYQQPKTAKFTGKEKDKYVPDYGGGTLGTQGTGNRGPPYLPLDSYPWTGYCVRSKTSNSRWMPVPKNNLQKIAKNANRRGREIFRMVYDYPSDDITSEDKVGDLDMDFDSPSDLEKARHDILIVADILHKKYGVDYEQIQYGFSGNKGFYAKVPRELFLTRVTPSIQEAFKVMLRVITPTLSTLDMCIYARRRMWRMNNTLHLGSGLYKINLTIEQLRSMSLEEIMELARKPHSVDVVPRGLLNPLAELYEKAVNIVEYEKRQKKLAIVKAQYHRPNNKPREVSLDSLPPNYRYLARGAMEGSAETNAPNVGRNWNLCKLVGCLSALGVSRRDIMDMALEFNQRCRPPKKEPVIVGQVEALLK